MTRPRLLDLFCGAGGAAMGYHRAGFEVVGVDIARQPHYPFEFHQADALTFPLDGFDAVHASPPCQAHVAMSNRWRGKGGRADAHVSLIAATRERLQGVVYVLENVPGAAKHLRFPVRCCGSAFGLRVERHRLFESPLPLVGTPCAHRRDTVGVYGREPDGRLLWRRKDGSEQRAARGVDEGRAAMAINWMDWRELAEAIPPAYTEFIGKQLLASLQESAA